MVLGGRLKGDKGAVLVYESENLKEWKFKHIITTPEAFGYMWECPDYFELADQGVLLFSPQGMAPEGDAYHNIYQSGYLIGEPLDFATGEFQVTEAFNELDRGFDFYAPQTMTDPQGRQLLVGWLGLPGVDCVTDAFGWAHCLTIPRELSLQNGQLYQRPVPELAALRGKAVVKEMKLENEALLVKEFSARTYELKATFKDIKGTRVGLAFRKGAEEATYFYYDLAAKKLVFDRSQSGKSVTDEYGTVRRCAFSEEALEIRLFMDESSVEIFVNDGLEVFTARIYSQSDHNHVQFFADGQASVTATQWEI